MRRLVLLACLVVSVAGCAVGEGLLSGWMRDYLRNDPEEIDRRARFEGYEDRWEAHQGADSVGTFPSS